MLPVGMGSTARATDEVSANIKSGLMNPRQFGPKEDFSAYPRREHDDFEMLNAAGVRAVACALK